MQPSLLLRAVLVGVLAPALALAQGLRFTTLDVGQGDAAVLVTPGGCVALFDGGPTGAGATIKAYLRSLGVARVDVAFVSHLHADHLGGLDEVEQGSDALPITTVYDHGGTYSSTAYQEYASQFQGRRVTAAAGQTLSLCGEVTLRVVASNANGQSVSDENARSVVVKVSFGAFDALVGGDLTGATPDIESLIASSVGELELYKVHHHGSKYSSNDTFLGVTRPLVSFISVGANPYGHPTLECLSRLAAVNSDVWQTEDPDIGVKLGHIALSSASGGTFTVSQGATSQQYTSKGGTPGPDTQPPSAPGSLVASAPSSSEVDLTWSASMDNVGVAGYRVYRSTDGAGFTLAGSVSSPGFADVGLSASWTYWYRVTALDAAGNESAASNTASATTQAPPALTVTRPNGGESWAAGSTQSVTWTSSSVAHVRLEYSVDNGSTWALMASSVSAAAGSYAWTVPNTVTSSARVRVSDAADGSPTDSSDGAFRITSSSPARVLLNEILANEPGSDVSGEFVELVNVGGLSIDLGGWTLSDDTGVRHTFPAGTVLAGGRALVVFGGAAGIPSGMNNAVAASTGALGLNNAGASVSLKNTRRKVVDSTSYTGSLAGTDGVSMNRNPDLTAGAGFVLHTTLSALSASPGTRVNGSAL